MRIQSGKLDRRITILAPVKGKSAVGQAISAWQITATVWGQRLELRTIDVERSAGSEISVQGRYLIRWRAGLTTAMRIIVDGTPYAISAIDEPDRRETLILTVVSAGETVIQSPPAPSSDASLDFSNDDNSMLLGAL